MKIKLGQLRQIVKETLWDPESSRDNPEGYDDRGGYDDREQITTIVHDWYDSHQGNVGTPGFRWGRDELGSLIDTLMDNRPRGVASIQNYLDDIDKKKGLELAKALYDAVKPEM